MLRRILADFGYVLKRPWARVVLLTVFLEGAFVYGAFAFIASHLHRVLGMSLSASGMVIMPFGLGGLLFAAGAKAIVPRLGEHGLALWGGLMLAAALLGISLAPSMWYALPGCLVAGVGFYMLHNTLQINATQMASERRGAAVAAFASCFFLGSRSVSRWPARWWSGQGLRRSLPSAAVGCCWPRSGSAVCDERDVRCRQLDKRQKTLCPLRRFVYCIQNVILGIRKYVLQTS